MAGLFLAGLALRPPVVGVGPLIPAIQDDLDVSHAVVGLLGTIPCCAWACSLCRRRPSAPLRVAALDRRLPRADRRLRHRARGGAWGCAVILLTFGVGIGLGFAQALMPVAVKERFAGRPALATGIYVLGINLGSGLSSALAVPLADARGQLALVGRDLLGVGTCVLVLAWVWLTRNEPSHQRVDVARARLPWRSGLAWRLVAIFGSMGCVFYGLNSWLPDAYVERGWSEGKAGALLGVLNVTALVTTIVIPPLADRHGSRRLYLVLFSALFVVSTIGFAALEGGAWVWAVTTGLCVGAMFPLVMTLPVDIGRAPAEVGAVAGLMLGVGYTISAIGPLALGGVRDATGDFTATLWLIAGSAAILFALCAAMSTERIGRGVSARRVS